MQHLPASAGRMTIPRRYTRLDIARLFTWSKWAAQAGRFDTFIAVGGTVQLTRLLDADFGAGYSAGAHQSLWGERLPAQRGGGVED